MRGQKTGDARSGIKLRGKALKLALDFSRSRRSACGHMAGFTVAAPSAPDEQPTAAHSPRFRPVIAAYRLSRAKISSASTAPCSPWLHNNSFKPKPLRGSA